jgi:hypothetical protein
LASIVRGEWVARVASFVQATFLQDALVALVDYADSMSVGNEGRMPIVQDTMSNNRRVLLRLTNYIRRINSHY